MAAEGEETRHMIALRVRRSEVNVVLECATATAAAAATGTLLGHDSVS